MPSVPLPITKVTPTIKAIKPCLLGTAYIGLRIMCMLLHSLSDLVTNKYHHLNHVKEESLKDLTAFVVHLHPRCG